MAPAGPTGTGRFYGLDVALAARRHNATPSFGALARLPITRTATQRTADVRALARDLAWLRDLGVVSLDDLVAEFSRRARRGEITPERPKEHGLLLGSLARPLWPQQVELGGLDTPVVAALYTLPAAARRAVSTWRARFAGRLLHPFTENAEFLSQHRYSLSYTRCNF